MTSKRLFFNACREDLRHKVWMIALSFLVSILAHPVSCLMSWDEFRQYKEMLESMGWPPKEQVKDILLMYGREMLTLSGIVAMGVAIVAGLAAFHFLFHKNSVDMYHSLPVKRRMLFGVCYVDGFLIWLVPCLVCMCLSSFIMGRFMREYLGAEAAVRLVGTVAVCVFVSAVIFLLVYNLILVAVMLSGNILNALVSMLILGLGGISVWGVEYMFFELYMNTFSPRSWGEWGAVYSSPFVSAAALLVRSVDDMYRILTKAEVCKMLLIDLGIAGLLGLCAGYLYVRRPSEHAEQGMRSRAVSALFRIGCGIAAGMCGWVIFILMAGEASVVWGGFGAVLTGALVFGALDIIFRMDFKAFFSHKLQMACTVALSVLICLCFYQDWFGYDAYLPPKEEIAEASVYNHNFANRQFLDKDLLEAVSLQDRDTVYAYLERMTEQEKHKENTADGVRVMTKVTLESGRSYYRTYTVRTEDQDVLLPLLTSREYLEQAYLLEESVVQNAYGRIALSRGGSEFEKVDPDVMLSVIRAYNQDLTEHPEEVVTGQGRMLANLRLNTYDSVSLNIYDTMERIVEALDQAGYGDWVRVEEAGDIISIELGLGYDTYAYSGIADVTGEEKEIMARLVYGVYGEETEEALQDRLWTASGGLYDERAAMEESDLRKGNWSIYITDPEEIEELLGLMSYELPDRNSGMFRKDSVRVTDTGADGRTFAGYIPEGVLPERFISRFKEL